MGGGDLVEAHPFDLSEVELTEIVAGNGLEPVRRRDCTRRLERALERARVDGRDGVVPQQLTNGGRPAEAGR